MPELLEIKIKIDSDQGGEINFNYKIEVSNEKLSQVH